MEILKSNNIPFEFELPVGRYNIDFALHDKKIALEIDGQQHTVEKQKESDKKKDEFLIKNGWVVYRIPWVGYKTQPSISKTDGNIKTFLEFYKTFGPRECLACSSHSQ